MANPIWEKSILSLPWLIKPIPELPMTGLPDALDCICIIISFAGLFCAYAE
jgi:hypothetical protein